MHVAWPARGRLIGSRKVRGADKLKSVVKTEREKDGGVRISKKGLRGVKRSQEESRGFKGIRMDKRGVKKS